MKYINILLVALIIGIPLYVYGYKPVPHEFRSTCNKKSDMVHDLIVAQQNGMDPIDMLDIYLENFPADGEHGQGIIKVISRIPLRDTPEERHDVARRISLAHYQSCMEKFKELP